MTAQTPALTAADEPAQSSPALAIQGLTKRFGVVRALTDVSLEARHGEILALVGENGAGKSTLLKILSGTFAADAGQLLLDGAPADLSSPRAAHKAGVRVIAQEPEILPHLDVAENVHVGDLPARGHVVDRRRLVRETRAELTRLGFNRVLDPMAMGEDLSPSQRQLVEILRALRSEARVIAFDEPTSSLSDEEVDRLFALITRLRDRGVSVIYVSHRMREIFRLADRITVLRDGRHVGTVATAETSEPEVVRMMVGRELGEMFSGERSVTDRVILEVDGLTTKDVSDISFRVHAGEVVGFAGLVGAGRSELAKGLFGDVPLLSGRVLLEGRVIRLRGPRNAIRAGLGYAPEERKAEALFLTRSVRENLTAALLDTLSRFRFVRLRSEREVARRYVKRMNVRTPSIEHEIGNLSGGNQQKTVLGRWLARRPKVLILDEPTRGVDVGAKAEIYRIIGELAAEGLALIVISSELPEVIGLADRILVMEAGRITGEVARAEATEEGVLALAMIQHSTMLGEGENR